MKSVLISFAAALAFIGTFFSVTPDNEIKVTGKNNYAKEWQTVDSLENLGLPKSALEYVEKIYSHAKSKKDPVNAIKAWFHILKYTNSIEENAFEDLLFKMEDEVVAAEFPYKPIYHSIMAEMYWMYYQSNRWKFYNRTNTVNFSNRDIQTWTLDQLLARVIYHYKESVSDEAALAAIPTSSLEGIMNKGTLPVSLRPTLYDFLMHRALNFYSNSEISLTRPADQFTLSGPAYFSSPEEFSAVSVRSMDTLSIHYQAVLAYSSLLKYRLKDDNIEALLDLELKRLGFVYSYSVDVNKDSLYLAALEKLFVKGKESAMAGNISYEIASFYSSRSSNYNVSDSTTYKYKWYSKKASDICKQVIEKYPESTVALKCSRILTSIEMLNLSSTMEEFQVPSATYSALLSYKNVSAVHVRVLSIDREKLGKMSKKLYGKELYDRISKEGINVGEQKIDFPIDEDFNTHTTEILLPGLPVGTYVMVASNNAEFSYNENVVAYSVFTVTDLAYIQRKRNNGNFDFYVMSRTTGKPIGQVTAQTRYTKYNYTTRDYEEIKGRTFTTDENGYFEVPWEKNEASNSFSIDFYKADDKLSSDNSFYAYNNSREPEKIKNTTFFTDRAIYRPGQTVYFKGITIESFRDERNIVTAFQQDVSLFDVNNQKIASLKLTTNEYGTFSGSFQIPTGLLNGAMYLSSPTGSRYIQVEEYKRPKFEVEFLPFDGNYKLNEDIEVTGIAKALAGSVISDAKVAYRVTRTPVWRGWWYYNIYNAETEIANGETVTDDNGEYKIIFKALPDPAMAKNKYLSFSYYITADVTDLNGETRSTGSSIEIGYSSLVLSMTIPSTLDRSGKQILSINSTNLNGEFIPAEGEIVVSRLKQPEMVFRSKLWGNSTHPVFTKEEWYQKYPGNLYGEELNVHSWPEEKEVLRTSFNTAKEKKLQLKGLKDWPSGKYVAKIKSKDSFGNTIENKTYFTIYGTADKTSPENAPGWFTVKNAYCEPGDTVFVVFGTGLEDVTVLYEVEHKEQIVEKKWFNISKSQVSIPIKVEEKHRGNFAVYLTFIKNNRPYNYSYLIQVPHSDKIIDMEFATFRDKLQPGQKEEWQIKLKGPKGEKVAAEMMATLYDASLDQFARNYWSLDVNTYYYSNYWWNANCFGTTNSRLVKVGLDKYVAVPAETYNSLNWFGFSYYGYYNYRRSSRAYNRESSEGAIPPPAMADDPGVAYEVELEEESVASAGEYDGVVMNTSTAVGQASVSDKEMSKSLPAGGLRDEGKSESQEKVKVRTNFNETAFFYPDLKTNKEGDIIISFTIPESLTKWRMMGFAHTKDLKIGRIENELVTQKELMLMPNAPRFFRENDKMEFPVKISNISEKDMDGEVTLEFFDALTMQPVELFDENAEKTQKFTAGAGKNVLVTWSLSIPQTVQAVLYRVVAKADKYSDGEENVIPVMTNRMLVTESLPLPIRGNQTKEFRFEKLIQSAGSKTLQHEKLTFEMTSNPAWYAVQALPYLMEYPYECYEQTFSRYYANSLAAHIANSDPKIQRVFDSWKNIPDSKALLSNLEKNQELKAVLLEETPWVLNAKSESENKRRVALLFDLNKMSMELDKALKKLIDGQVSNGGWPWFEGMPDNRYITQHIVCGLGHLDHLGVKNVREESKVWNMTEKAVLYCDDRMREDYENLLKLYSPEEMKKKRIGQMQIHYLYARSYFKDIPVSRKNTEAFQYYKAQAQEFWLGESKYMQGMIALALYRYEDRKVPADIVKSLREHALDSEEMGMYWKENNGYYWYQAPIERQALMIEVFDEVAQDQAAVDNLKVWLIKQKQTQDWNTTKATAEAIYALLLKGSNWLASDDIVTAKLGTVEVDPAKMENVSTEAGTGYYKVSWNKNEIVPDMGVVTLTKKDEGVSWGALYWQYFEQLDKITPHETPLSLKKQLFIEKDSDRGKVIDPVSDKTKLKVGDKVIVRIELRVDRMMEYVHMKDMRASGFEPVNVISRYKYQDGLGYYETTKDASTNFFIAYMPKGTYVFEYPLRVTHNGDFSNGITSIQCMYAPEFASHSEGIRVTVEK